MVELALLSNLYSGSTQVGLHISEINMSTIDISWGQTWSVTALMGWYKLMISHGLQNDNNVTLTDPCYTFTAPEGAPPCEVYNFSVTATYDIDGATYTGASCSVSSSDNILVLYGANLLTTNDLWTEVNLLGELIFNITIEVSN